MSTPANKQSKTVGLKALGAGKAPAVEQMAKINQYALVELAPEQVHVRRYLMAHNGIDRDVERFNEDLLDNFAQTLPGKGFFVEGHPSSYGGKGGPGKGRYFDASTEMMSVDQFKALTGETIKLPEGIVDAKVLWGDAYLLRLDSNADTLANIDGGIYSFDSIGFKAPLFDVTDDRGNTIYGEYRPHGEALEGSLVWLGAQPGAAAVKSHKTEQEQGGKDPMKEKIKALMTRLGKTFSEETAVDDLGTLIAEKDAKIGVLTLKAADGDAYRKHLVDDIVKFGTLVGEIPTTEAEQKTETDFIATWPIERIKALKDKVELVARKQFPEKFTIKSKDETDKQQRAAEAGKTQEEKKPETSSRKDYSKAENNELLATIGK